jgi:hypothetical protein
MVCLPGNESSGIQLNYKEPAMVKDPPVTVAFVEERLSTFS